MICTEDIHSYGIIVAITQKFPQICQCLWSVDTAMVCLCPFMRPTTNVPRRVRAASALEVGALMLRRVAWALAVEAQAAMGVQGV